jgi:hypothetical protein
VDHSACAARTRGGEVANRAVGFAEARAVGEESLPQLLLRASSRAAKSANAKGNIMETNALVVREWFVEVNSATQ